MKNIHVLPTEKPSRLGQSVFDNSFHYNPNFYELEEKRVIPQNIYITSDEKIKEGDWFFNGENVLQASRITDIIIDTKGLWSKIKTSSRVVLTTDQDLIKDGVQPIPDEFLEWFVKNTSCESVETYSLGVKNQLTGESGHYKYEIIIPQEKIKTNLEKLPFPQLIEEIAEYYNVVPLVEEPKQETLEEAAERIYREYPNNPLDKPDWRYNRDVNCFKKRKAFIAGAEWAAEKMYSEEDMKQFAEWLIKVNFNYTSNISDVFLIWNKQHKKK
jgi:hypothetical protein